jgi:hypothetical protein
VTGIGSLPWFAGVWWLAIAVLLHALATLLVRIPGRFHLPLVWWLVDRSDRATATALRCAKEGRME